MRPLLTLVLCLLLVPVCAPAAPVPKIADKPADYFPTKVGDEWVYLVVSAAGKAKDQEWVERVTAVAEKDGVKTVTISRVREDKTTYFIREREVSAKGVVQLEDSDERYDVPWVHLKLPHKAGQSWDVPQLKQRHTAHGPEEVKVPAGTYNAVRVEHREEVAGKPTVVQTEWFAPRVGIVKLVAGDTVITMKSFTPGKD